MEEHYRKIFADPAFQAMQRRRTRFSWLLAAVMLVTYFGFILVIAFEPALLAIPLGPNTVITWGIPIGVGIIVLGFALTGLYVYRANGEFDSTSEAIVRRVTTAD
ncbi:MAG: DUF485 domain-containing protein [Gammaproteobacteria bacterium]